MKGKMGAQSHTGRTETGKCLLLLLAAVKRWVDNRRALGSGALGGKSKQMKGKTTAQSHKGRTGTGKGKEKEREKQANERKMKAQSHTGRIETAKGKEKEREEQANERKNENPEPHRMD